MNSSTGKVAADLLDQLPVAVCVRDASTLRILAFNTEAERLSGIPRDRLIGTSARQLTDKRGLQWLDFGRAEQADGNSVGVFEDAQRRVRTMRVGHARSEREGARWLISSAVDLGDTAQDSQALFDVVQRLMLSDFEARVERDHSQSYGDQVAELINMLAESMGSLTSDMHSQLNSARTERDEARAELERLKPAQQEPLSTYRHGDVEAIAHGVLVCDQHGCVVAANQALATLLGRRASDIIGAELPFSFWPDGPTLQEQLEGRHEGDWLRADGKAVRVEAIAVAANQPLRTVISVRDLSAEHAMRQRLFISERQATIGTLASGVAHEINNPLMYISGNLELAVAAVHEGQSTDELLEMLQDASYGVELVRKIAADLRTWTRAQSDTTGRVNLNRLLQSCLSMAGSVLKHRARTELEVAADLLVRGDEARLAQLFLNLLVNAAQSIEEGSVELNLVRVRAKQSDDMAVVEISDSGCGISEENIARMFEPFFTTKNDSGVGLGMALVADIIKAHQGDIAVHSTLDEGTTVTIKLPIDGGATSRKGRRRTVPPAEPALSIMLIDDDDVVADTLKRSLRAHEVVTMSDARQALTLLRDRTNRFDVVLCDVLMPMMSGIDFYSQLSETAPGYAERVIFLTGGGLDQDKLERLEDSGRLLLWKPIKLAALRKAVASVAAEHGAHMALGRR